MSQANQAVFWKKTYVAEGAISYGSLLINGTATNQIKAAAANSSAVVGVAMNDAATTESIDACIIGDVYILDYGGALNRADRIQVLNTASYYHTAVIGTQGTDPSFGTVVGDDAATTMDLILCRVDCSKPPDIATT